MPACSCIVCGCFCAIRTEMSSCHKDHMAQKAKNIYYMALYRKYLLALPLSCTEEEMHFSLLDQCFSGGVVLPLWGPLVMPGDIFGCHNEGQEGVWWVEARDAARHPAVHRTAPLQQRAIWPSGGPRSPLSLGTALLPRGPMKAFSKLLTPCTIR